MSIKIEPMITSVLICERFGGLETSSKTISFHAYKDPIIKSCETLNIGWVAVGLQGRDMVSSHFSIQNESGDELHKCTGLKEGVSRYGTAFGTIFEKKGPSLNTGMYILTLSIDEIKIKHPFFISNT